MAATVKMKFRFQPRMKARYEMDMCNGPLLGKIIRFAIPLMLSGMLQVLFNAADIIVVGRFAGPTALAAVGSTGAMTNLIVNLFIGLSIGTNVLVARYYGGQKMKDLSDTVHTSVLASLIFGAILAVIGIVFAKPLLLLMGNPGDVIDQAALYMKIYFAGMPFLMLYNFGAAVLRAIGDTKRPLYFLSFAGVLNVLLNLVLVIVFHLGVAGVAIATIFAQAVSAALVLLCLMKANGPYQVHLKELRMDGKKLWEMAKIGMPAGMQGMIFSMSNVLIQSSINSFGSTVMAGNTAAGNIEAVVYCGMNAFYQSCLSFCGQNLGAKKYSRIKRVNALSVACVTVVGIVLGGAAYLFANGLLGIYSSDPEVIAIGRLRMLYLCVPYFICGVMDTLVGTLRGIGKSVAPMLTSVVGVCGIRVVWVLTVFQWHRDLPTLYISYIVSWAVTALCHYLVMCRIFKKFPADGEDIPAPAKK